LANNIAAVVNEKQTPLIAAFFYLTIMLLKPYINIAGQNIWSMWCYLFF